MIALVSGSRIGIGLAVALPAIAVFTNWLIDRYLPPSTPVTEKDHEHG